MATRATCVPTARRHAPWLIVDVALGVALGVALTSGLGCAASKTSNVGLGSGGEGGDAGASSTGGHTTSDAGTGSGAGGATGSGGSSAGATGGSTGGADAGTTCLVTLTALSSTSFADVEAGPGARLRVEAVASGVAASADAWIWTVKFGDTVIPTTAIDDDGSTIEFPVADVGSYQIAAQLAGNMLCHATKVAQAIAPPPASFVLRTIAAGFPVQERRISPNDPSTLGPIELDPGITASIFPQSPPPGPVLLASYVRVTSPLFDFSVEGDTTRVPLSAQLASSVTYDVLVIPNAAVAPQLFTGTPAQWTAPLVLDQGVPVTARARLANGGAVVGARMILRRGSRPSTVGTSDGTGAMTLWTRAGPLSALIVPPSTSGLPSASVGAGTDPGIALDASAASLDLQMTWNQTAAAPLSFDVRGVDGVTAVVGARVRVTSHGAATPVGTLVARAAGGASVSLQATGATDVEVVSDATGAAAFPSLPLGVYDVTIVPPVSLVSPVTAGAAAITSTTVTLAATGLARAVTLAQKVSLAGTLLPIPGSAGTRVTAIDKSDIAAGTAVSAMVAGDGRFTLSVDPGRSYQLVADPAVGTMLARAVLGTIVTATGATVVAPHTLPAGQLFSSTVSSGGVAVSGALIQIFCPATSARCLDPSYPLAAVVTRGDGTFDLILPQSSSDP